MKGVIFDGAIPRYVATRAAMAVSSKLATGNGRCTRLRDVALPTLPSKRWVRLRTRLGGICGSDLNLVRLHVSPSTSPFSSFPFVIGHENVGTIETIGPEVTRFAHGERVVINPLLACAARAIDPPCRNCTEGFPSRCERFTDGHIAPGMMLGTTRGLGGSWGEFYLAHESQLFSVPRSVDDRAAVLVEPLATVISPLLAHPPAPGARILVIGAGSLGLLTVAALEEMTDADVTLLARYNFQAEHGERLGAERIVMTRGKDYFGALSKISEGRLFSPILGKRIHIGGFDTTIVCVGTDTAVGDALRFTRAGGTVILLGNVSTLKSVDWTPLWLKELTFHGSLCYNSHAHEGATHNAFDVALSLISGGLATKLQPLVSHVFPLQDYREALSTAMGKPSQRAIKVAFSAD